MSLEPHALLKISWNQLKQRQKICKYEQARWPAASNKIFKFLPNLDNLVK